MVSCDSTVLTLLRLSYRLSHSVQQCSLFEYSANQYQLAANPMTTLRRMGWAFYHQLLDKIFWVDQKSVHQRHSALSWVPHSFSPTCPSPCKGTSTSSLFSPRATNRDKPHTSFSVDPEAETCQTPCNNHSRTSFSDGFAFSQERVSVLLLKTTETTTSSRFSLSVTSIYLALPYHFPHFFVSVPVPNYSPFSTSFPQPSRTLTP